MKNFLFLILFYLFLIIHFIHCSKPSIEKSVLDSQPVYETWDFEAGDVVFIRTKSNKLYRSIHGGLFNDESSKLEDYSQKNAPTQRIGIRGIIQTHDPLKIWIIGYSNIWVTLNGGAKYKKVAYNENILPRRFKVHPSNSNIALMSALTLSCYTKSKKNCRNQLFYTEDFGTSWELISEFIGDFSWSSDEKANSLRRIYATKFNVNNNSGNINQLALKASSASLYLTDSNFQKSQLLFKNVTVFQIKSNFINAAWYGYKVNGSSSNPRLLVSTNNGKTFTPFQFPLWNFAQILSVDFSSQLVFTQLFKSQDQIHVGSLWHSDESGLNFVKSLDHVSFTNGAEVHSSHIPGIFFANVYSTDPSSENVGELETLQSRNNAASFYKIKAPAVDSTSQSTNCHLPSCSLHFSLSNLPGSWIWHPSAPGFIITRGNTGLSFSKQAYDQNMYLSRDAGQSWQEIRKNPWDAAISDYASIIVMGKLYSEVNSIVYSSDQGLSFKELALDPSNPDDTFTIRRIKASPSNSTIVFNIFTSTPTVFTVQFPSTMFRTCGSSDFETYHPRGFSSNNCLLGREWTVTRRKRTSDCFVQSIPQIIKYADADCICDPYDKECNVGYTHEKNGAGSCVTDPDYFEANGGKSSTKQRIVSDDYCKLQL